jgi:cytochrome bd ubiquinol oxidase subunit I
MIMDHVLLSRLQFAFTIGFHILWPTFTIGVASFVALLSGVWWWTGRPIYGVLMRFWIHIFAVGFGMGVVTGLVLSYEIGTNWSGFSRSVSNVLGPMLLYEVLTAFFLEAGFIGIVLFGENRVGQGMHFFACCMVAVGTLFSATWILAANSWMQTPAGYTVDAQGIYHIADWWAAVFNPSFPFRFMHMVCASYLTGAFVIGGVSAFHLWQRRHLEASRKAFSIAMWTVLILVPLQIGLGDAQGLNTREYQPTKLAAMEGLWDSGNGVAATLLAWPDMALERNRFAIEIPHIGSVYLTHSWNGYVQGLKAVPAADRPYVPIVFFAFRIMVGIGLLLLAVALTGAVLRWRGRLFTAHWFHLVCMAVVPLGFLGVLAGWTTTETGRQPFVVYGQLRTVDTAAPLAAPAVASSLLLFVVLYGVLLLVFLWYGWRIVIHGPGTIEPPTPNVVRPGIDRAATALVSGVPARSAPVAAAE